MRRSLFCTVVVFFCLFFSCNRGGEKSIPAGTGGLAGGRAVDILPQITEQAARPAAILQAGGYPLWFRVTADGPVLMETIEDAVFSAALIPWPHAPHIRFTLARGDHLAMAVNQSGFICLAPQTKTPGTGLHYIPGGELWRQYTVASFFLFDENPVALLYRDDFFLDSDMPPPDPRLWTYNLYTAMPEAPAVPALDIFSPGEGWNIDTLRFNDDCWYFRTVKKPFAMPEGRPDLRSEIRMLRADDLSQAGEQIPLGAFQNSARPEPFSAAPEPLQKMLVAVLAETAGKAGTVTVISPEFQSARGFSGGEENDKIFSGFYSPLPAPRPPFLIVIDPQGTGLYAEPGSPVRGFSLPALPENFFYTGIGLAGDTVFASWEEQEGYSIGAAGFMALQLTGL